MQDNCKKNMKHALPLQDNDFSAPLFRNFLKKTGKACVIFLHWAQIFSTLLHEVSRHTRHRLRARLYVSPLYAYFRSRKTSLSRTASALGLSSGPRRAAAAFTLSACCLLAATGFTIRPGDGPHTIRMPLSTLSMDSPRQLFTSAERLRQLAVAETIARLPEDPDYSPNWRVSGKMTPVGFADSLPKRDFTPAFFAWSDEVAPRPSASMLGLRGGKPVLKTAAGVNTLPQLTDIALSAPSMPYESGSMQRIATGELPVETMLSELRNNPDFMRGQFFVIRTDPTATPQEGGYADDLFTIDNFQSFQHDRNSLASAGSRLDLRPNLDVAEGMLCRSDRVELASWIGQVRRDAFSLNVTHLERASKYSDYVERYASNYELPPSLVYAIMRTESAFNPKAVSIANALGLMQVVPHTAGGEVHAFLTGKRGIPKKELLFTPEHNIQYGTAYLYLLNNRHFKDVSNPISRELCMIAAYNGGPNAVLRSFNRHDRDKALAKINSLTPEELYDTLVRNLPSQETRDYVVKVVETRNKFRHSMAF